MDTELNHIKDSRLDQNSNISVAEKRFKHELL